MIAHALARRILEADDDMDIAKEIQRLSGTTHPGVQIEVEGNHWYVYRLAFEELRKQGSIYYSDPRDFPEDMTQESRAYWSQYSWDAIPTSPHVDGQVFKTFDEAVAFLANIKWVGEAEEIDPENVPEPDLDPAKEIDRYTETPTLIVQNPESRERWGSKRFLVEITWDDNYGRQGEQRMQPMVTFYDHDEAEEGNERGQKVARYCASSIAAHRRGSPLSLNASVGAWWLERGPVEQVLDWLHQELEVKRGYKLVQNWPFDRYESLEDPDSPDLYTNHQRSNKKPIGEAEESEQSFLDRMVKSPDAENLQQALWKFHPYGVGYLVTNSSTTMSISVRTYFELPRRDAFAEDVKSFVEQWLKENPIVTVRSVQMTKWDTARPGHMPNNGFTIWINIPFDVTRTAGDEAA